MPRIDVADGLTQLPGLDAPQLVSEDMDGPARRMLFRATQAQDRRLAGAVRADERPPLAGVDGEVDVREDRAGLPHEVDRFQAQDFRGRHGPKVPDPS